MSTFQARTYSDPHRASDSYHLPEMVIEADRPNHWTVVCCLPGCLPEGEEMAFPSACSAFAYAYESQDNSEDAPDYILAFRYAFQGSINRLRGSIAIALADEARFASMYEESERNGDTDGMDHVEELAHDAARFVFSVKA